MSDKRFNMNPTEGEGDNVIFDQIAAQSKALSEPHPEIQDAFRIFGKPRPYLPTRDKIGLARKGMSASIARFNKSPFVRKTLGDIQEPECLIRETSVPTESGHGVPIRIYTPGGSKKEHPVLVMAHSGGFCTGGHDTEEFICRLLCRRVGLIVVDIAYRLAPEHNMYVQRADVSGVIKWVSSNAHTLGGCLSKGFLVAGVSGGGCHVVNAVYDARDEKMSPPITGVLIISMGVPSLLKDPYTTRDLLAGRFPSYEDNKDAPYTAQKTNEVYAEFTDLRVNDPRITPLYRADHSNLPPIYYQIPAMDLLRDPGIYWAYLLNKAGSVCRTKIYPGMPHTWWVVYHQCSVTTHWAKDLVEGSEWLLQQTPTERNRPRL